MSTWFQAAYDPNLETHPWVVLRLMTQHDGSVHGAVVERLPTRHEAEGKAKKWGDRYK